MIKFHRLAALKLVNKEKLIIEALYQKTKSWISESNQINEPLRLTAKEMIELIEGETEISWSVQLLIDLGLINKVDNTVELTPEGRIYGALLAKDLQVSS